jgi:hypothetical protein
MEVGLYGFEGTHGGIFGVGCQVSDVRQTRLL